VYLYQALRFSNNEISAFVGAGGKTSAIFTIGRELASIDMNHPERPVIVSTTTHLGDWQAIFADHSYQIKSNIDLFNFEKAIPPGVILLFDEIENHRLTRLREEIFQQLFAISISRQIPLLIEADGSRGRPLKAPANDEPVIPEYVNTVVVVAGLSGLGKPLSLEWVHRPEIFSELSGLRSGETITSQSVTNVLLNENGGLKNIPSTARKVLLLNHADNAVLQAEARIIAKAATNKYSSIVISSINHSYETKIKKKDRSNVKIYGVFEKIGGIILAAGSSSRFGMPKQLLKMGSVPFIRQLANTALKAGLSPVIVVLGSSADEIGKAIHDIPVKRIINPEWQIGISSSIKVGLKQLPDHSGGAIFLNADQPQTPVPLILKLIEEHEASLAPIVAPQIDGQRGNPVLFDRTTFDQLMDIEGDTGGRAIFHKYRVSWVQWHDRTQLLDIDTPEDYQKFLKMSDQNGK
jgi:molybdenum cofactor cytidylyltransferase